MHEQVICLQHGLQTLMWSTIKNSTYIIHAVVSTLNIMTSLGVPGMVTMYLILTTLKLMVMDTAHMLLVNNHSNLQCASVCGLWVCNLIPT